MRKALCRAGSSKWPVRLHAKNAQRFADLCVSRAGGFLKVGQLLSSRPDLLPQGLDQKATGLARILHLCESVHHDGEAIDMTTDRDIRVALFGRRSALQRVRSDPGP